MNLNKELLDTLACPACHAEVRLQNEKIVCQNSNCGLRFPVKEGIPVMLIEEAEKPVQS
ncbi:MAG: Trm112 family protein [Candidatus Omnitrophica bacterium]|nr:Trm112 family protein [Candidatus Omnitrophota bacterium]